MSDTSDASGASEPWRVLLDANVLIDFLLDRAPFADAAAELLSLADRGDIQGLACADSFTTIFYLARKAAGKEQAQRHVGTLLSMVDVASVNRATLEAAIKSGAPDFEDAVVMESARQARADYIVTRNEKDFAKSSVPAHSPRSMLGVLSLMPHRS